MSQRCPNKPEQARPAPNLCPGAVLAAARGRRRCAAHRARHGRRVGLDLDRGVWQAHETAKPHYARLGPLAGRPIDNRLPPLRAGTYDGSVGGAGSIFPVSVMF